MRLGGQTSFSGKVQPVIIVKIRGHRVHMSPGQYKLYGRVIRLTTALERLHRGLLRAISNIKGRVLK